MCGIFGVVSLSGLPLRHPGAVAAMAAALAHRGPDGERIVGHERARLGARRLAIMDLTTGDQPFESPDHTIWMICNGEIYNAPALRQEGKRAGYPFRSSGDIETIVPLYQRLGPDAVARLEGMFELAVWDDARGRLVLARDRAGEKPLFWTEVAGELRFASEVQALLVYPDQPRRVNPEAVALYAALGYVPAPLTMIAGISKLPPAHQLVADRSGVTLRRYWDAAAVAAAPPRRDRPTDLRAVLLASVERELMSDVPVGVFTSGGRLARESAPHLHRKGHVRIPAQGARGCGPAAAARAAPHVVRRARAGRAHGRVGERSAGPVPRRAAPEPPGVARLPLLPARQPARQSRSRNDARVDRGARALPGPRGDGAGAAAAVVAQGAWLHQQGDIKGSGARARPGRGDPPSQARSLGAGGALAHHGPGGARRAPPHRTAAVPERPDGGALGRAPVGETEPRPQALATAHGGVVGGTVERGYDGCRGGLTPGPCPGVTGNPGLAPGVSETGRLMNRTEALQLMHEHTKSASLRQ